MNRQMNYLTAMQLRTCKQKWPDLDQYQYTGWNGQESQDSLSEMQA